MNFFLTLMIEYDYTIDSQGILESWISPSKNSRASLPTKNQSPVKCLSTLSFRSLNYPVTYSLVTA